MSMIYHRRKFYIHSIGMRRKWLRNVLLRKGPKQVRTFVHIEHPKCGRSWLRFMIQQAEALKYGVPLRNTVHGVWYRQYDLPRLVYHHGMRNGSPVKETHFTHIPTSRQAGWILQVRQPERVMISWFYEATYRAKAYDGSISEFIRDPNWGIRNYVDHVEFYSDVMQEVNHMLITYENLRDNTFTTVKEVLEFIDLVLPDAIISEIVDNSTFTKMQKIERENRFNVHYLRSDRNDPRTWKTRTGGQDRLEDLFDPSDLDFMRSSYESSDMFIKLGYTIP